MLIFFCPSDHKGFVAGLADPEAGWGAVYPLYFYMGVSGI